MCHFPELRTLTADEAEDAEGAGPPDTLAGDLPEGSDPFPVNGLQAAAYDPAFLLRFCVQVCHGATPTLSLMHVDGEALRWPEMVIEEQQNQTELLLMCIQGKKGKIRTRTATC